MVIGLHAGVFTFSVRSYLILSKQNVAKLEIGRLRRGQARVSGLRSQQVSDTLTLVV